MSQKQFIAVIVSLLILGTTAIVMITTFLPPGAPDDGDQGKDEPPLNVGSMVLYDDAVNAFSFSLFDTFLNESEPEDNVVLSPYSIFTALAMTYEGAHGDTASEMSDALHILQSNESFHAYVHYLYQVLNAQKDYTISTANALWVKEHYPLLPVYTDLIATYYGGNSTELDFSDPSLAAAIINSWIELHTQNLIHDLLSPSDIDPLNTALILTNAIYFKGTWLVQFDEHNTTQRPFERSNGDSVDVDTMRLTQTATLFNYTETDIMQVVELPYAGSDISMVLALPKDGSTIADVVDAMDDEHYEALIGSMTQTEADIYLPKFTIESPVYRLKNDLIALGMPTAFSPNADFSGMNGVGELFIDDVLHKAYIEVNEEGTEAAAATAVIMKLTSTANDTPPSRVVFDADHPFVFLIQHNPTGTILFLGTVNDPSL